MSDDFTIGAGSAPSIFECPQCKETIDLSADSCRFCGTKVDREAAEKAALVMKKINQACSDSSYMMSSALAIPLFFLLRFLPFFSMVGTVGFIVLLIVLPAWALRWGIKFSSITTDDKDFIRARKNVKMIGITATVLLVFLVITPFVVAMLGVLVHR